MIAHNVLDGMVPLQMGITIQHPNLSPVERARCSKVMEMAGVVAVRVENA